MMRIGLAGLLGSMLWVASGAASAATSQTWTLTSGNCITNCASSNQYRQYQSNLGGIVSVQAIFSTNSSLGNNHQRRLSTGGNALVTTQDPNGVGITNPVSGDSESSSPNHAVDNVNNRDFLLLDFGQLMDFSSFSIGWKDSDGDLSFMFAPTNWNMSANPLYDTATGLSNGTSITDLIGASWKRQDYENVATNSTINLVNSTYTTAPRSRYVLVSGQLNSTDLDDAFKFKTITGKVVPLPGTLALFGAGIFALGWQRRRG